MSVLNWVFMIAVVIRDLHIYELVRTEVIERWELAGSRKQDGT
jgi:hypothetical protein